MFDDTPINQLRAELLAFQKTQQSTAESVPLPPGVERSTLTPEQAETLFENWTAYLNDRPAQSYTPAERAAINFKIARVLKAL